MRGHDPMPRISQYPAALTPVAIRHCTFTVWPPSPIDLDELDVARLHGMQVSEGVAWVLCHPDSDLKSFEDAVPPAASQTGDSPCDGTRESVYANCTVSVPGCL
jgi:hypothetical protein